jgi:hypothetical protein
MDNGPKFCAIYVHFISFAIFVLIILKKLKELSLNILKFIITKGGNIHPMAGKRLLTVSRNGITLRKWLKPMSSFLEEDQ